MKVKERLSRIYERFALAQAFGRSTMFRITGGTLENSMGKFAGLRDGNMTDNVKKVAEWLKNEAGTSGSASSANGVKFLVGRDAKGLVLQVGGCRSQNGAYLHTYEFRYGWRQVAKMVLERGLLDEAR